MGKSRVLSDAEYICAYCGEVISTTVDPTGGRRQTYTEDCQVCCRPNVLRIEIDPTDPMRVQIDAEPES